MNDTLNSTLGKLSLNLSSPTRSQSPAHRQSNKGLSPDSPSNAPVVGTSPPQSAEHSYDDNDLSDPGSPTPAGPSFDAFLGAYDEAAARPRSSRSISSRQSMTSGGLLPYSGSAQSGSGIREEKTRVERLENEIFQLKLKITLLERNHKLGADAKALYSELSQAHAANRKLRNENASLEQKLTAATKQRQDDIDQVETQHAATLAKAESDREEMSKQVEKQNEMLQTFLDAQDVYSYILDELLGRFNTQPHLKEYAPTTVPESVDEKLAALESVVSNLINAMEIAQDHYQKLNDDLDTYLTERDTLEHRIQDQDDIMSQFVAIMPGVGIDQLPEHVADVVANNRALEQQLSEHVRHQHHMSTEIENLTHKANLDVHHELEQALEELEELRKENKNLVDVVTKTSTKSYDITRKFFRRLTAHLGAEWSKENEERLQMIVEESKTTARSKLPMLVDLMMTYVDELAVTARQAEQLPRENAELEEKNKLLEGILSQELTRLGADSVLLARYRDLENRLKIEQEKRKNEYVGYQRSLMNLSTQ